MKKKLLLTTNLLLLLALSTSVTAFAKGKTSSTSGNATQTIQPLCNLPAYASEPQ